MLSIHYFIENSYYRQIFDKKSTYGLLILSINFVLNFLSLNFLYGIYLIDKFSIY